MLGSNSGCRSIETTKDNASFKLTSTHIVKFSRAVDDVVDGLKRKIHSHELNDRSEAHESSTTTDSSEAGFSDGGVPQSVGSPFVDQSFRYLVCAVIVGDLFSHNEHLLVSGQLFIKGFIKGLSNCDFLREISDKVFGDALIHSELYVRH